MTVTEALAYIADLQAHPEVQLVNHRKLREAAAVLADEVRKKSPELDSHRLTPEDKRHHESVAEKMRAAVEWHIKHR